MISFRYIDVWGFFSFTGRNYNIERQLASTAPRKRILRSYVIMVLRLVLVICVVIFVRLGALIFVVLSHVKW